MGCASAPPKAPGTPVASNATIGDQLECHDMILTGTRLPSRVCETKAQRDAREADTRDTKDRMSRPSSSCAGMAGLGECRGQ